MSIPQVTKPYTHVNNTKADGNKVNANDDTAFAGVNLAIGAINQAAGAKNSLKERLDILLNQDGTPRSGVTAGGEWANPDLGPQYVSATQFTVAGDHSDIYHQRRRLNINDGAAFATISSASFNGGTGLTTITITESVLTDPISKVEHGIINMQEDLSSIGFSEAAHPNRGVMRDSAGRAKVVAPAVDSDIALLSTLKLYGIGRDADGNQVTNLDTLFTTGIYPVSTTATGTPTSGSSGAVIVARAGAGGRVSQLFMSYVNSRMYRRDWQGAAWDDWMRVVMGVPSSATSTSTNAITDLSHTHAIDSTIARSADLTAHTGASAPHSGHALTTRNLTAGNGLSGGGTLAADRTFTLGTPGSATATTTNSVSSTSHTHAVDSTIARSAISLTAGNGLTGGGTLEADRTFTMGTPGATTRTSTNGVTTSSHTHAFTPWPGMVMQEVETIHNSNVTTTSTALTTTGISATITPLYSNSIIEAICYLPGTSVYLTGSSVIHRTAFYQIRNVTNSANGYTTVFGRVLAAASSAPAGSYGCPPVVYRYTVNSTAARTFTLFFAVESAQTTLGTGIGINLILREIKQ
jgi:hypothetical protein